MRAKESLLLPEHEYQIFRYEALHVNKYGFVTIDTNKYGVSPSFPERSYAKIFFDCIELYHDHACRKLRPKLRHEREIMIGVHRDALEPCPIPVSLIRCRSYGGNI